MKSLKTFLPIALSLVIAAGGSFTLYKWIQGKQGDGKEIVHVPAEASPVIVAAGDLAWGTKLKPEMLKTTPYLKESLPEGHFTKLSDITGRVLISPVKANDPITVSGVRRLCARSPARARAFCRLSAWVSSRSLISSASG